MKTRKILRHRQEFKQEPTVPLHHETEVGCPKIIRKPALVYPVTIQQPGDNRYPKVIRKLMQSYRHILLRRFEEAVVSYDKHSTYVKQTLNSWATQNRNIPQDWKELATEILKAGPHLQWIAWWQEEARVIEQWNRARGINNSQDQLLGENQYAEMQQLNLIADSLNWMITPWPLAALSAWDKVEESGKKRLF